MHIFSSAQPPLQASPPPSQLPSLSPSSSQHSSSSLSLYEHYHTVITLSANNFNIQTTFIVTSIIYTTQTPAIINTSTIIIITATPSTGTYFFVLLRKHKHIFFASDERVFVSEEVMILGDSQKYYAVNVLQESSSVFYLNLCWK